MFFNKTILKKAFDFTLKNKILYLVVFLTSVFYSFSFYILYYNSKEIIYNNNFSGYLSIIKNNLYNVAIFQNTNMQYIIFSLIISLVLFLIYLIVFSIGIFAEVIIIKKINNYKDKQSQTKKDLFIIAKKFYKKIFLSKVIILLSTYLLTLLILAPINYLIAPNENLKYLIHFPYIFLFAIPLLLIIFFSQLISLYTTINILEKNEKVNLAIKNSFKQINKKTLLNIAVNVIILDIIVLTTIYIVQYTFYTPLSIIMEMNNKIVPYLGLIAFYLIKLIYFIILNFVLLLRISYIVFLKNEKKS